MFFNIFSYKQKKEDIVKKDVNNKNLSISVSHVSKIFKIPHEQRKTLKSFIFNLFKRNKYTELKVAEDISFNINEGEFFGIIGRNGSGKSTMLKMLAKIYQPNSGKISIKGRLSPFLELGVGFNPELSAHDNVYLNGTILGLTRKEIDTKFNEIIEFAELEEFVDHKLKNFSSGMQVRLAFSVAVQAHADIVLIDEVLAVGDYNFQQKCFDKFRELKQNGKTVVFVSHSMGNIEEFCDRVLLLDKGKISFIGSPKEAVHKYNILNILPEKNKNDKKSTVSVNNLEFKNSKNEKTQEFLVGDDIIASGKVDYGESDVNIRSRLLLGVGLYDEKNNLIIADSIRMIDELFDTKKFYFKISIPSIKTGIYQISISIRDLKSDEVYFEKFKSHKFYIQNITKTPAIISSGSFWHDNIEIIGLTRVRNESLIIQDTIDHVSKFVDKIIVLNDASTDDTLDKVYSHPKVIEVINNKIWKKDRAVEETESRQLLLEAGRKYNPKWFFYFDADERFIGDIKKYLLSKESLDINGIRISLFDAYITTNDKSPYRNGKLLNFRQYFGPERRDILMIWRNNPSVKFSGIDAREPFVDGKIITKFFSQHYGKSISIKQWEDTCDYYANNFPMYSTKWLNRKGKAVHLKSDFNRTLYPWESAIDNSIKIHPKK